MFYNPLGVLTRPPPDWFLSAMQVASAAEAPATALYTQISIFNAATDGANLWIYGLIGQTQPSGTLLCNTSYAVAQPQGPQGWSITPNAPGGPGYITTTGLNTLPNLYTQFFLYADGQGSFAWPYNWPIAIVPPASQFNVTNASSDQKLACTFWWIHVIGGLAN